MGTYKTYEFVVDDMWFRDHEILAFRVSESVSGLSQQLQERPPVFGLDVDPGPPAGLSPFQRDPIDHLEPSLGLSTGAQPAYFICVRLQRAKHANRLRSGELLGKSAALTIGREPDARTFHGEVFRARQVSGTNLAKSAFDLFIYPWLWNFAFTRKSRVWTGNTLEILEQMIASYPSQVSSRAVVDSSKINKILSDPEYNIQYNESDYQFLHRNFEREGLFYYFVHERAGYKLVFGQENTGFWAGDLLHRQLTLSDDDRPRGDEPANVVSDLVLEAQTVPQQHVTRDYNPQNAGALLEARTPTIEHPQRVYEYPGQFDEMADGMDNVAPRRFKAENTHHQLVFGASRCQFMAPGEQVRLPCDLEMGTPAEVAGTMFVVPQVVHDMVRSIRDGLETPEFRNVFQAQSVLQEYSPAQLTPYPALNAPQIATVQTSSQADQVDVDEQGRPLVTFKWDLLNSRIRVRLAQGWAGENHGMQVLPRRGDEVMVDFVDNQPNRPVIVASLYNSRKRMLFPPAQSGQFSSLTKAEGPQRRLTGLHDAGGNLMLLYDEDGSQRLVTAAGKDRDDLVVDTWTTKSRYTVETVVAAKTENVGASYDLTIGGDMNVLIEGDVVVTIRGKVTFTHG